MLCRMRQTCFATMCKASPTVRGRWELTPVPSTEPPSWAPTKTSASLPQLITGASQQSSASRVTLCKYKPAQTIHSPLEDIFTSPYHCGDQIQRTGPPAEAVNTSDLKAYSDITGAARLPWINPEGASLCSIIYTHQAQGQNKSYSWLRPGPSCLSHSARTSPVSPNLLCYQMAVPSLQRVLWEGQPQLAGPPA